MIYRFNMTTQLALLIVAITILTQTGVMIAHGFLAQEEVTQPIVTIEPRYTVELAEVTAYTKHETCPDSECVTASGTNPEASRTVACPRKIELGTKVEIDGKIYVCEDRTAQSVDGRYDIYYGDDRQAWLLAKEYGVQKHLIKIYK